MTHPLLIKAMLNPATYPHRPRSIRMLQTHISFIFIADDLVYKVKKAVDFGFLDFTTLEKRKFYCLEELRLNKRLAPRMYLEVAAICQTKDGAVAIADSGSVIEYAVVMKRLPEHKMLRNLLADGKADLAFMDVLARTVHEFHVSAATGGEIDDIGRYDVIRHNHVENFEQTAPFVGRTITAGAYRFIEEYALAFLSAHRDLFEGRVLDHRIRECHGDLHLEHICVDNGITIFDCIEFNERFRYLDVAAEVAFLAMDLDYNGYHDCSRGFLSSYIRHSGDHEIGRLADFYCCYFAYVRGKVIGFTIDDNTIGEDARAKARATAARYFTFASGYAARLQRPTLIITTGLMGSGKSSLARRLSPLLGAHLIQSDVLRKEMLGIRPAERHHEDFSVGIYSEHVTRNLYACAFDRAEGFLKEGNSVLIDASFRSRGDRLRARELAAREGADFFVVECTCPPDTAKKRLERRVVRGGEASDGRWELYESQKKSFEPITEFIAPVFVTLDTSGPEEETLYEALRQIRARG